MLHAPTRRWGDSQACTVSLATNHSPHWNTCTTKDILFKHLLNVRENVRRMFSVVWLQYVIPTVHIQEDPKSYVSVFSQVLTLMVLHFQGNLLKITETSYFKTILIFWKMCPAVRYCMLSSDITNPLFIHTNGIIIPLRTIISFSD